MQIRETALGRTKISSGGEYAKPSGCQFYEKFRKFGKFGEFHRLACGFWTSRIPRDSRPSVKYDTSYTSGQDILYPPLLRWPGYEGCAQLPICQKRLNTPQMQGPNPKKHNRPDVEYRRTLRMPISGRGPANSGSSENLDIPRQLWARSEFPMEAPANANMAHPKRAARIYAVRSYYEGRATRDAPTSPFRRSA